VLPGQGRSCGLARWPLVQLLLLLERQHGWIGLVGWIGGARAREGGPEGAKLRTRPQWRWAYCKLEIERVGVRVGR
jgi:hypothetical protein